MKCSLQILRITRYILSIVLITQFTCFTQSVNSSWSNKFANPGLFNKAQVVTKYNQNEVVFAGNFELPSDSGVFNNYLLAFWDGSGWSIQAPGSINLFNSENIYSICAVGTDIYIGGNFSTLNSSQIAYLAKWDGTHWSEVGGGVNGPVLALTTDGTNLWVGGHFSQVGGITANNIAKWDGSNWSTLQEPGGLTNGVNNIVRTIALSGNGVYVGGDFTVAGGINAYFAAKYNSLGSWEDVGVQWTVGSVSTIGVTFDHVYLGGSFNTVNGWPGTGIVRSDGAGGWEAMGNGSPVGVQKLLVNANGFVYAQGDFSADAGSAAVGIAEWDGTKWIALGTEPFFVGGDFALVEPNIIYTAKFDFQNQNYLYGNGVYMWDGSNWAGLGNGIGDYWTTSQYVKTLEWYDSKLVAGGYFLTAGDKFITSLAQFDGNSWSDLGGNSSTPFYNIYDLLTKDGKLYAAGTFLNMGGIDANNIAVWDGSTWSNLGLGVDNSIQAMHSMGNDIYVTGPFFNAGGSPAVGYARWDGSSWYPLGSGGPSAYTLASIGNDLYAGGRFSYLNGGSLYVGNIARWDGITWNEMNGGVSGPGFNQIAVVNALAVSGNNLIVGGDFKYAGTTPANNIAIWDGSQWSALGEGLNGPVKTIFVSGNDIYVGGQFTDAGGNTAFSIAKWNGISWNPLSLGLNQSNNFISIATVSTLLPTPEGLYIGGQFTHAGDKYSNMIALYKDFVSDVKEINYSLPSEFNLQQNYPNPFNPSTAISFQLSISGYVSLKVYDVLGNKVTTLVSEVKSAGNYEVKFDASQLSSGIYFYKLQEGSSVETKKMILLK
jgi:hypothetical protein